VHEPAEPAEVEPDVEASPPDPQEDAPPPPDAEPVDLLRAVPTAVAVSSAYRDSDAQAANLVDGDLETAWNSRTGELAGAWVALRVPADARVTAIEMTAGYTKVTERADLFTGNHRVARVRVTRGGETVAEAALDPESRQLQAVPIEGGGGGDFRVEIVELVAGSRDDWRETCISELRVLGHAPDAEPGRHAPRTAIGALPELAPVDDDALEALAEDPALFVQLQESQALRVESSGDVLELPPTVSLARAPDGYVWSCEGEGTQQLVHPYGNVALPSGMSCGALAVGPDQRAWMLAGGRLAAFDGQEWAMIPTVGLEPRPAAIAATDDGTLWVVTSEHVYWGRGEDFEEVAVRGSPSRMWQAAAAGSHVVVRHAGGLLRRQGEAFVPLELSAPTGPVRGVSAFAVARDGTVVAAHPESGSFFVAPAEGPARRVALDSIEGRPMHVHALAFDGSRRLWMWADAGLYVLGPGATTVVRRYPPGSLPDLTPASHGGLLTTSVTALYVEGAGPTPLPTAGASGGRVTGRLKRDGEPLAHTVFHFCTDPMRGDLGTGYGDPCERTAESPHGYARFLRTRADGTFDVYDAPDGEPVHVVLSRGDHRGWFYSGANLCCERLRPRATLDMGSIEVP